MRYIARAYENLGDVTAARSWYFRAAAEAPHLREPYLDLAQMLYRGEEWDGVLYFTGLALAIRERPRTYICEAAPWGSLPHDLRAISLFRTGRMGQALEEAKLALELEPANGRLRGNVELLERLAAETQP